MNCLESIVVHVDGTARSAVRLDLARQLAAQHKANLDVLFAVDPRVSPMPFPMSDGVPSMPASYEIDPRHREHAWSLFAASSMETPSAGCWYELTGGAVISGVARHVLLCDLLVLGQHDPTDASGVDVPPDLVEAVLIESGRPALVIPACGAAGCNHDVVLVAWKQTREAARALIAALPFLGKARQVHLACMAEGIVETHQALAQASRFLVRHGIARPQNHQESIGGDIGRDLLSMATGIGADLLVMGCYGHGRLRERVLGGATRTVLREMTVPVLMAH